MIWYDEEPATLSESVLSLAGFADGLVAIDGAFKRFPLATNANPWSSSDQIRTIVAAAAEAKIPCITYQPTQAGQFPYESGNEVEKRNAAVFIARDSLGADWIFNHDADMVLHGFGRAHELIARTEYDVVLTEIEGTPTRNVYRVTSGMRHEFSHWLVINERGVLSGPVEPIILRKIGFGPLLPALDLYDMLQFDHPERKDFWRRARQEAWYDVRDRNGIESVPGSRAPDLVQQWHPLEP